MNCPFCNKEFESPYKLAYHKRICDLNPKAEENKKLIKENALNGLKYAREKYKEKHPESYRTIIVTKKCLRCGKEYSTEVIESHAKYISNYCSIKCANTHIISDKIKSKISNSLKKRIKYKERICKVCGKHYYHIPHTGTTKVMCSEECSKYYKEHRKEFLSEEALQKISNGGKRGIAAQGDNRRSKNEKEFCLLCEQYFNNVDHNKNIFNSWDADIILYDYKIAVLWNGPWHYKEISHTTSLKQIQNRDKIKLKEIKNCGWTSYIIKDLGKYNKDFVQEQFEIFKKYINTLRVGETGIM